MGHRFFLELFHGRRQTQPYPRNLPRRPFAVQLRTLLIFQVADLSRFSCFILFYQ